MKISAITLIRFNPVLDFIRQTSIWAACHTFEAFRTSVAVSRGFQFWFVKTKLLGFHRYDVTLLVAKAAVFTAIVVYFNLKEGIFIQ